LADVSSVTAQRCRARGFDLLKKPLISATRAKVGRAKPHADAAFGSGFDGAVRVIEIRGVWLVQITRFKEGRDAMDIRGGFRGELVLD